MSHTSILWRRLDRPGHEAARLCAVHGGWELSGTAVFVQGSRPCRLDYRIVCDAAWRTRSALVEGWVGEESVTAEVEVDGERGWRHDGMPCLELAGCVDIDLQFSPSTNLLPIRRAALAVGSQLEVKAAWLRFPEMTLATLEQRYQRVGTNTYRYESAGGRFVRELSVNEAGFVTHYPDFWRAETA